MKATKMKPQIEAIKSNPQYRNKIKPPIEAIRENIKLERLLRAHCDRATEPQLASEPPTK
jgi:hypothetical protein